MDGWMDNPEPHIQSDVYKRLMTVNYSQLIVTESSPKAVLRFVSPE